MTKRFSGLAFIGATLIHIAGTWALFVTHFRAVAEYHRTGVESHSGVLLRTFAWIWDSLPLLVQRWCESQMTNNLLAMNPVCRLVGPSFLIWALCFGALFGLLVPRFFAWRHESSNRSLQPTAGNRGGQT